MIEFVDDKEKDLLVRIDYGIVGSDYKRGMAGVHINCDNKASKSNHYLAGGGFLNKDGGSMVFKTNSIDEVKEMMNTNIRANNMYEYRMVSVSL